MSGVLFVALVLGLVTLLAVPIGEHMARVYDREEAGGGLLGQLERGLLRLAGEPARRLMDWKRYAIAMLVFNAAGFALTYVVLRVQAWLPWNPEGFSGMAPGLALNTAASFVTNTNWQAYAGESTLGSFAQMAALAVQNFASAASGMACLVALVRGLRAVESGSVGNFWIDLVRSTVHVLLPLSFVLALVLVSQGVVQSLGPHATAELVDPVRGADGPTVATQTIPMGPVASQIAIKQLGTNGGGFFNANSAHPFENPTAVTNLLELVAILLLPAALCFTFGRMVGDVRQGWTIYAAMTLLFVPLVLAGVAAEEAGNPRLRALGVDDAPGVASSGGNLEGKEVRFGVVGSAVWAAATTAASNGSVDAMHDSFTPLGGLVPLFLMQLGEVVYGGVGSGLYGMLVFALVAVFVAGLMVGRTPEYLGKKVAAYEMKMAALVILVPVALVLVGTAAAVATPAGLAARQDPGAHGFSEILYAFSSLGNNNGSAFAGLSANTPFYDVLGAVVMLGARYGLAVLVLAIAGSFAAKRRVPFGPGTLPTHGALFAVLLAGVVVLVGALTFVPALALGPVAEHVQLQGGLR